MYRLLSLHQKTDMQTCSILLRYLVIQSIFWFQHQRRLLYRRTHINSLIPGYWAQPFDIFFYRSHSFFSWQDLSLHAYTIIGWKWLAHLTSYHALIVCDLNLLTEQFTDFPGIRYPFLWLVSRWLDMYLDCLYKTHLISISIYP